MEEKSYVIMYLVAIIAIVAIVGMVILYMDHRGEHEKRYKNMEGGCQGHMDGYMGREGKMREYGYQDGYDDPGEETQ